MLPQGVWINYDLSLSFCQKHEIFKKLSIFEIFLLYERMVKQVLRFLIFLKENFKVKDQVLQCICNHYLEMVNEGGKQNHGIAFPLPDVNGEIFIYVFNTILLFFISVNN